MNRFHLSQILCLFWSVTLIVSCGKNIETPWEENHNKAARRFAETTPVNQLPSGPFCAADPQGNYAGDQVIIGKKGTENDISFAEGGGCILNTTAATWENLRKSEFLGWNRADLTDFHPLENPNFAFVISTSYSAGPGIFKQRWNLEWRHTLVSGSVENPNLVLIDFQKVKGTDYIKVWKGQIELKQLTPSVTSFAMRYDLNAAQSGEPEVEGGVRDYLQKLRP
jgi:hypothetical protein